MTIPLLTELVDLVQCEVGDLVDHVLVSQVPYYDKRTELTRTVAISAYFMNIDGHEIGYWYTFYDLYVVPVDPPLEWSQDKIDQHKRIQIR